MQTLTQRRSVPVDAAKTAAIFGTLLIHASAAGGFAGAPGSFGWTSALFWNCLLRSAVPVFFLCSGALLLPPEQAAEEIRRAVSAKGYSTQDNYTAVVIGLERGTRA